MNPIAALGAIVLRTIDDTGTAVIFVARSLLAAFKPPFRVRLLFRQMEFVGIQSLSIVAITGLFTGMVMTVQSDYAFSMFGAQTLIGATVILAMTRELSPVLTALMVNGRVGSAMAAELGTMRVTEQIDALDAMAVDAHQYLVTPRIFAGMFMVPVLTGVFNAVGLFGTLVVSNYQLGINQGGIINRIEWYVDPEDILAGLIKSVVFGGVLAAVGCFKGFHARGGAEGVGAATTEAVVTSSLIILVSDYFITLLLLPWMNG